MKIEDLSKIKNKNVQQQNQLDYLKMKKIAENIMENSNNYPWLLDVLKKHNLNFDNGIVISLTSIPEQFGNQWLATWLTFDKQFYDIDIMANYKTNKLIEIDEFNEIFPKVSSHCKGIGKSSGYLALELLKSFNAD
ncbi:MAG: hypothetical protein AB8B80_10165 [Marinicellaceae bacterium]